MKATLLAASLFIGQTDFVRTMDGSTLHGEVAVKNLEVETAYGRLSIPWTDIRSIEFGVRPDATTAAEINKLINNLGSTMFKERDEAQKVLIEHGPLAVKLLSEVSSKDVEVDQRIKKTLASIRLAHTRSFIDDDVVETSVFTARGKIVAESFSIKTTSIGDVTINRQRLAYLDRSAGIKAVTVNADGSWHDTGIKVKAGTKMMIKATGSVDLWFAQGPGQYVTGPRGYTTAGKDSTFMAGALVGAVGSQHNTNFVIGEDFSGSVNNDGNLLLRIVPSPWNNDSAGSYAVRITMERR
jgi:hypothetical protein